MSAGPPIEQLLECARALRGADIPFMIVGALAVAVHGEPRTSNDLDFVIHLPYADRSRVEEVLRRMGHEQIEERKDEFGQRLVVTISPILKAEFFFTPARAPYDEEYRRRVTMPVRDEVLPFISAEDLVLRKLVNTRLRRGQDYDDLVSVIATVGASFDHAYVRARAGIYRVADLFERAVKDAAESEPVN